MPEWRKLSSLHPHRSGRRGPSPPVSEGCRRGLCGGSEDGYAAFGLHDVAASGRGCPLQGAAGAWDVFDVPAAVVAAETWHGFKNTGSGRLRIMCIHASPVMIQEFLEGA